VQNESTTWLSSGALARALEARDIHFTASTVQRYAREGRLPARVTPGGHYRFDLESVLDVLATDALRRQPHPPGNGSIDRLLAQRGAIRDIVARNRGLGIAVFGSVARGEAGPEGDIDFLVDFAPDSSLFDLLRLTDELSDLLGRPVDVVSSGGLKARDEHIRREAVPL